MKRVFVNLLACAESILVCADPGGLVLALPHFQKYGVFDEITLNAPDKSEDLFRDADFALETSNLTRSQKRILERAKPELRKAFGRG